PAPPVAIPPPATTTTTTTATTTTITTTTVPSGGGGGGGGGGSPPPTSYTVTFNANGGSGTMASQTESSPTALTTNSFANAGYTFTGWNTSANGSGRPYADDATYPFAASATLYAQWSAGSSPMITQQPSSQAVETGVTATFSAGASGTPTPTVQWFESTNGGSTWSSISGATSPTYSIESTASVNDYEFEATFSNVHGSVTSHSAQLTSVTTSSNWSGYADTGGVFSAVSAQWTVPTVTCSGMGYTSAVQWIGIDGYGSSTVEQDGTDTDCDGTTPSYGAWYEMYGDASVNDGYSVELSTTSYPVAPGNVIDASVSFASDVWTLRLEDATAGWTFSTLITSPTPAPGQTSAEWIVEDPEVCLSSCSAATLSDYGSVTFTNASVTDNGATGSIASVPDTAIEITDGSGNVMSSPGVLSSGATTFTDTWESSS
ncbi:MAG: hypothetical protein JWM55_1564, partial [Acidimicrobiaceae bacterium]|nr:hypothetical protein [Acidimicrobiaceae bacterium]